jgi:iron-sulfur cluster repair protein YtfE (RIC family)
LAADAGFLGCYRLDLCCGGIRPLAFVAQKHGLSLQEILGELNAEIAGAPSATK